MPPFSGVPTFHNGKTMQVFHSALSNFSWNKKKYKEGRGKNHNQLMFSLELFLFEDRNLCWAQQRPIYEKRAKWISYLTKHHYSSPYYIEEGTSITRDCNHDCKQLYMGRDAAARREKKLLIESFHRNINWGTFYCRGLSRRRCTRNVEIVFWQRLHI